MSISFRFRLCFAVRSLPQQLLLGSPRAGLHTTNTEYRFLLWGALSWKPSLRCCRRRRRRQTPHVTAATHSLQPTIFNNVCQSAPAKKRTLKQRPLRIHANCKCVYCVQSSRVFFFSFFTPCKTRASYDRSNVRWYGTRMILCIACSTVAVAVAVVGVP